MSAQSQGQGNKGTKILIIVFAVVVVLLIGAVVVLANNVKKAKEEVTVPAAEQQKRQAVVTEENAEEVVADLFEEDDMARGVPGSFDMVMTTVWHFPDGESESTDAYVENSVDNTKDMYFDVRLTDTQETIYESPLLPLGTHVDKIKLTKNLEPGTYDCELTYHLVDEEQNTLGTVDVVVTVIVEN